MRMSSSVTAHAERNEILFDVVSQPAAGSEVVDLKISRLAAVLAAPAIAREHRAGELAIGLGIKPQPRPFPPERVQWCSSLRPTIAASAPREER